MCKHTRIYTQIHTDTHAQTHIYTHMQAHTHIHMHTQIHTDTHIYTQTYTYRHTYIHTLIHTDTHSWTPTQTHRWAKTRSGAPFVAQLKAFIKTNAASLIFQSLPRLFSTPGPQAVGFTMENRSRTLYDVSSVGLVALLSRRCGDRGRLSLELKRWQERCLVCDEAWSQSLEARNPGNSQQRPGDSGW